MHHAADETPDHSTVHHHEADIAQESLRSTGYTGPESPFRKLAVATVGLTYETRQDRTLMCECS